MSAAKSSRYAAGWRPFAEGSWPPANTPILAAFTDDAGQWLAVLTPADDEGCYYHFAGTGEFAEMADATHWSPLPEAPR